MRNAARIFQLIKKVGKLMDQQLVSCHLLIKSNSIKKVTKKCMTIKKSNFHVNNLCWTWTLRFVLERDSVTLSECQIIKLVCLHTRFHFQLQKSFIYKINLSLDVIVSKWFIYDLPASTIECSYQCQWNTSWGHHKISLNEFKIEISVMYIFNYVVMYVGQTHALIRNIYNW